MRSQYKRDGELKMTEKIKGRRWNVGDVAYKKQQAFDDAPPFSEDYEFEVVITKENIDRAPGRTPEYYYSFDVLNITNNAPEHPFIPGISAGNDLRKNPYFGKKFWK